MPPVNLVLNVMMGTSLQEGATKCMEAMQINGNGVSDECFIFIFSFLLFCFSRLDT